MKEKTFAQLCIEFKRNPQNVPLPLLRSIVKHVEGFLKQFKGFPEDEEHCIVIPFQGMLKNIAKDAKVEIKRRFELIGDQQEAYDELKGMFEKNPLAITTPNLQILKYLAEEKLENIQNCSAADGIPHHAVEKMKQQLETLIEEIDIEGDKR